MMRNRKILILLLTVCLLLPTLFGCARATDEPEETSGTCTDRYEVTAELTTAEATEPPPPVFTARSVFDCREYIKLIGRSRLYKGAIVADWSASGIEFEYEGSGNLEIVVERDGAKNVVLIAEVDGESKTVTVDQNGSKVLRLATDLPEGAHHVLIRRRTMVEDAAVGLMLQFKELRFCGTFLPKPANKRYMVAFIGDSITCGVGLPNTDGLATYAVDFCRREKFDYDICSVSGIGVAFSTVKHKHTENTMTKYYPFFNYYRSNTLRYMPERKADLVVVNLNTNDNNNSAVEAPYKAALKTLLTEIREAHGENVKIVWIVGMMISKNAKVNGWLKNVFDELGGESAGLYRLEVETDTAGEHAHPSASSHAAVSLALSQFIREKGLLQGLSARVPK